MSLTEYVTSVMKNVMNKKRSSKCCCLRCRRKFGGGTIIKSILDYRFNSNKHRPIHMFLFETQALWFLFIVRIWIFCCVLWVYSKSLNGSPACDYWTQTSWQIMQRDSDTTYSGKPHIVLYCVKRNMGKSVAVLPQVWKIHC